MTERQRQAVSEWEKNPNGRGVCQKCRIGQFWAVLDCFGKCHPHYRVHIAGSLPLLHSPTDAIFQHRTPSAQDSEPKIAFSKRSIWAQMGPNGPNGLRPHFLRPHQSALEINQASIPSPKPSWNPYRSLIDPLKYPYRTPVITPKRT